MNEIEWMVYFFKGLITIYSELRAYCQLFQICQVEKHNSNVALIEEDAFCLKIQKVFSILQYFCEKKNQHI
jgi:hypothetical protein